MRFSAHLVSVIVLLGAVMSPGQASAQGPAFGGTEIWQLAASLLLLAVVIGVLYNFWKTTQAYGGIIGQGIRRVGVGMIFLCIEAFDRIAISFGANGLVAGLFPASPQATVHDLLLMFGLLFITLGFIKFSSAVK